MEMVLPYSGAPTWKSADSILKNLNVGIKQESFYLRKEVLEMGPQSRSSLVFELMFQCFPELHLQ